MYQVLEEDVVSILDYFGDLEDPRSEINKKHVLGEMIVIAICAVIAGADGPKAIGEWAQANSAWLSRHLQHSKGIPSHDTIGRLLATLKPKASRHSRNQTRIGRLGLSVATARMWMNHWGSSGERAFGSVVPPRTGKPGRPKQPYKVAPAELKYATVHKTREKGRVTKIDYRVVCGTVVAVMAALEMSLVSRAINTAFVERHNGTDRNRNGRKVRKTYCFSKDWQVHEAVTYFTMYTYNFCWPVRTLRVKDANGHWQPQTPAIAAKLTDHVWSLSEWLTFPAVQRE